MKWMSETLLKVRTTIEMQYWKITNRPPLSISWRSWSGDRVSIPLIFIPASPPRRGRFRSCLDRHRTVEHRKAQRRVADADQVVVLHVAARQTDAVHERAVPAGEVLDGVLPLADDHDRSVLARHFFVVQDDVALLAPDRVRSDAGDVERLPLKVSFDHREVDRLPAQGRRFAQHPLRRRLQGRLVDGARPARAGHQDGPSAGLTLSQAPADLARGHDGPPLSSRSRTSTPCLPAGTDRTCVTVPDLPF